MDDYGIAGAKDYVLDLTANMSLGTQVNDPDPTKVNDPDSAGEEGQADIERIIYSAKSVAMSGLKDYQLEYTVVPQKSLTSRVDYSVE